MKFFPIVSFCAGAVLALPAGPLVLHRSTDVAISSLSIRELTTKALQVWQRDVADPVSSLFGLETRANNNIIPAAVLLASDAYEDRLRYYTREDIQRAINRGNDRRRRNDFAAWGDRAYPDRFHNYLREINTDDMGSATGQLWSYPLAMPHAGEPNNQYDGGDPGSDRVVFDETGRYVAVLAHEIASNSFLAGHEVGVDAGNLRLEETTGVPGNRSNLLWLYHFGLHAWIVNKIQGWPR